MRDPLTFESRLTDALERYAAGAPIHLDGAELTAGLVARRVDRPGFGRLAWPFSRTARLVLVAALLGAALVAGLLAAGMTPKDPPIATAPGRILVWQPTAPGSGFATMIDSTGQLLWSQQIASRGCPWLVAGSGIATRGFGTMEIRTDRGDPVDELDINYNGGERWAPDRRAIALVDMEQGPITVVRFGEETTRYGVDGHLAGAIEAAISSGGDRTILAVRGSASRIDLYLLEDGSDTIVHREAEVRADLAWLSISPDGSRAAAVFATTATGEAQVRILSLPDGRVLSAGPALDGLDMTSVHPVSWSPDGRHFGLRVGSLLHLYDDATATWQVPALYSHYLGEPSRWRTEPETALGLASISSGRLVVYREGEESEQRLLGGYAAAFSPDGSLAAFLDVLPPAGAEGLARVRVAFADVWGDGKAPGLVRLPVEHPAPPDDESLQPCIDWQPGAQP